jgi:sensor domain CHASE-containing protein
MDLFLPVLSFLGVTAIAVMTWSSNRRSADRLLVQQLKAEIDVFEKRAKTTDDYVEVLRGTIRTAGVEVPPWPTNTLS